MLGPWLDPDPALQRVWLVRGLLYGLLLFPLGWLPLLPLGYALHQVGLPWPVDYLAGAFILLALAVVGLLVSVRLRYRNHSFQLDSMEIRIRRGILARSEVRIPYAQLEGVAVRKGPLLRFFGLGTIQLRAFAAKRPDLEWSEARLEGLGRPDETAREILLRISEARGTAPGSASPTTAPSYRAA